MSDTYPIYVAGKFITTDTTLDVDNPHTGEVFAQTYLGGESEFEIATIAAVKVQEEMANMPSHQKFQILRHIADRLTEQREHIGHILAREAAKPLPYAIAEVDRAASVFTAAAEECKRIPGEEVIRLDWTVPGTGKLGIVKQFPIGPVAGIAPFNFPLNLAMHKVAPAIASGCPIVLKPASSTPLSTLEIAKIIDETDLPAGAVSIIPMNRTVGNLLVTDDRYKLLTFTGSPWVGWKMKADAGEKPVVLELGGNAGVILDEDTDLDTAIPKCMIGAFAYQGQVCIHAQRFFVHESLMEDFLDRMKTETEKLKFGEPTEPGVQFSSMIDEKNAQRIEEWVNEAIEGGANVVTGGNRDGAFYAPTILTNAPADCQACAEEAFGPIIVVESFSDFDQAIDMVNDSKFGLQAGVFTNDIRKAHKAFNSIEAGGVIINDIPTFRVDHMPYGGVKQSGLGREGVKYAMKDMLEPRIMVIDQ